MNSMSGNDNPKHVVGGYHYVAQEQTDLEGKAK